MPILKIPYSNGNGIQEFIRFAQTMNAERLFYQTDNHGWDRHYVYFEHKGNLILVHTQGDPFEIAVQAHLPLEQKHHQEIEHLIRDH